MRERESEREKVGERQEILENECVQFSAVPLIFSSGNERLLAGGLYVVVC